MTPPNRPTGISLRHPFWQAVAILVVSWVVIQFGIPLLPGSSLVPRSVVFQYMATVLVGVLIWVSDSEERWRTFKEPIHAMLVEPRLRRLDRYLLVASDRLKQMILDGRSVDAIREAAREEGMRTLRESGLLAIGDGATTVEEVLRET